MAFRKQAKDSGESAPTPSTLTIEGARSIKTNSLEFLFIDIISQSSAKKARPKANKQPPPKSSQPARPPRKADDMSQDEAALVIQKQFRGFQARKEYGPMISSSEKMSTEVAMFMKQYCRKWKAKSLFQLLLMYRAQKHQESVYMSQQVHLYNQNAVSALQISNKERVSLNNIDPDTTPSKFLGKFIPRQWKLPFRLNDMPFCDSSYLCNTLGKRTLTKDDAPWDDPYKRRSRVMTAAGKSIDIGNIGLPVDEGGDVFSFIQTPYTRDPNYVDVVYSNQPYRKGDHYFTEKSGKERRNQKNKHLAPSKPNNSFQASQSQFVGGGGPTKSPIASSSPLRTYVPPPPNNNFVVPQYNSNNENFNYRDKLKPANVNQKQNPIKELEDKFKQITNNNSDNEEETPTFNFQAMLRKTNHNRASLRRSPEMEMAPTYGQSFFPIIPEQRSVSQTNNYNNNVVYNSSAARNRSGAPKPLMRQDSGDCRKMMSHHYKESARKAKPDEVTTEIAPGIIIQGQEADL